MRCPVEVRNSAPCAHAYGPSCRPPCPPSSRNAPGSCCADTPCPAGSEGLGRGPTAGVECCQADLEGRNWLAPTLRGLAQPFPGPHRSTQGQHHLRASAPCAVHLHPLPCPVSSALPLLLPTFAASRASTTRVRAPATMSAFLLRAALREPPAMNSAGRGMFKVLWWWVWVLVWTEGRCWDDVGLGESFCRRFRPPATGR